MKLKAQRTVTARTGRKRSQTCATKSPKDTEGEEGLCPLGWPAPVFPPKQIAPSIHMHMRLFSASWVGLKLENICTSFVGVWFIRTPCGLLSPFSSSSPLGLGGFVFFVFKQACVSWDWVTLIYYALDSLTKDSGTGHLFSEWRFPVLPQPCSAGASWSADVLAALSPWENGLEQGEFRGQKTALFLRAFLLYLMISFRVPFYSSFFFSSFNKWDKV